MRHPKKRAGSAVVWLVLTLTLAMTGLAACGTPVSEPETAVRRAGAVPGPGDVRRAPRRFAKAQTPFVAVLPGARLYARPELKAPFVTVGLTDGKAPRLNRCDRLTRFPTAMRALKEGHGWVQVETLRTWREAGKCISRNTLSERFRFRAWIREGELGMVVRADTTVTYGKGLKLKARVRAGTAVLAMPGRAGRYCVSLNLPLWQSGPRGNHTNFVLTLPRRAVGARFAPGRWSAPPKQTHQICRPGSRYVRGGPCPMRALVRAPRAVGGGQSAVWLDGTCARNEVLVASKEVRIRHARAKASARTLGILGALTGLGASKRKRPPNPTVAAGQPLWWMDGTRAGKLLQPWIIDLGQTSLRRGRLCTHQDLGVGPRAGLCFSRTALRLSPIPRGRGKYHFGATMGVGAFGGGLGGGYFGLKRHNRQPEAKLTSVSGARAGAAAVRAALMAHLGHLELCHMSTLKPGFGTLRLRVQLDGSGRVQRITATPSGGLSPRLATCARMLLRVLPLRGARAGRVEVVLRLAEERRAIGGFGRHPRGKGGVGGGGSYGIGLGLRAAKGARVALRPGKVTGGLDGATVSGFILKRLRAFRLCYGRLASKVKPRPTGTLRVSFTIDTKGRVRKARLGKSTLRHKPTRTCVLRAVRRWRFPRPKGRPVKVSYPFLFHFGGR